MSKKLPKFCPNCKDAKIGLMGWLESEIIYNQTIEAEKEVRTWNCPKCGAFVDITKIVKITFDWEYYPPEPEPERTQEEIDKDSMNNAGKKQSNKISEYF